MAQTTRSRVQGREERENGKLLMMIMTTPCPAHDPQTLTVALTTAGAAVCDDHACFCDGPRRNKKSEVFHLVLTNTISSIGD